MNFGDSIKSYEFAARLSHICLVARRTTQTFKDRFCGNLEFGKRTFSERGFSLGTSNQNTKRKIQFQRYARKCNYRREANNRLQILPVNLSHALYLENLPLHHKDRFDRLLTSQAIVENMILVSADPKFSAYPVNLLW